MREDIQLLKGAIDIHTHTSPDLFDRIMDHVESAKAAKEAGMRAVVMKAHYGFTPDRIHFVKQLVDGIEIYGGVTLNNAVGGINPYAVEAAIRYGAKIIWMPTLSSQNHIDLFGEPSFPSLKQAKGVRLKEKGIRILNEKDKLIPEITEVLKLISDADIALATGHLTPYEIFALVKKAKQEGIKKIVINHPEYIVNMPVEQQVELAKMGAFIEHLVIFMMPAWYKVSPKEMAAMIRKVGAERTILATDLGQIHNPPPVEGMRIFVRLMLEQGIPAKSIEQMIKTNPATLLGL